MSPDRRRRARTPDTICLLAGMAVTGAVLAAAGFIPASVEAIVPTRAGVLWGVVLAVSAALALAGIMLRDPLVGWTLELGGRCGLACTTAGYTLALLDGMGENYGAALAVVVFGSISVASIVRVWQLVRRFARFHAAVSAQRDGSEP